MFESFFLPEIFPATWLTQDPGTQQALCITYNRFCVLDLASQANPAFRLLLVELGKNSVWQRLGCVALHDEIMYSQYLCQLQCSREKKAIWLTIWCDECPWHARGRGHSAMMLDTACGVDRDVLSHICVCAGPGVRGPDTSVSYNTLQCDPGLWLWHWW